MKLTVLGTAAPFPVPDGPCSGYLLESATTALWIEAGPGTLAELQRVRPLATLGGIWVSHRHVDHSADLLPAYYALRYGPGSPASLPLFAPDGLHERIADFVGPAASEAVHGAFPLTVMSGFGDAEVGDLRLSWAPVQHGVPAFALRVESGGRSLVFSGDCAPCGSLTELAEDADVFICEAGYSGPQSERAHHTPEQAGSTAAEAGAKRLLLTHVELSVPLAVAATRAAATFGGPVEGLRPGSTYSV